MDDALARAPVRPFWIVRHPLYGIVLPVPIVCFLGVVLSDFA